MQRTLGCLDSAPALPKLLFLRFINPFNPSAQLHGCYPEENSQPHQEIGIQLFMFSFRLPSIYFTALIEMFLNYI